MFPAMMRAVATLALLCQLTRAEDTAAEDERRLLQVWEMFKSDKNGKLEVEEWSSGGRAWQEVLAETAEEEPKLWTSPNYCDPRVIHGSAPLSVLFGMSTFYDVFKEKQISEQGKGHKAKTFELHVVGAAYPFEGRSDWSLLAKRRPASIDKLRVVLVLGTPWQSDNTPNMAEAAEFDTKRSLLQLDATTSRNFQKNTERYGKPVVGKVKDGTLSCPESSTIAHEDEKWLKKDICKDHGNGLEVVCVEKNYQDVSADLPTPDLVAMFSPGFPQIARRSWDQVLTKLLDMNVPILVSDLNYAQQNVNDAFKQHGKAGSSPAAPGDEFSSHGHFKEDFAGDGENTMTHETMQLYGAEALGSFRSPFPIVIPRDGTITVKNAVTQVFQGRNKDAQPVSFLSGEAIAERTEVLNGLDVKVIAEEEANAKEIKDGLMIPTSDAYDKAMMMLYHPALKRKVHAGLRVKKQGKKAYAWTRNGKKVRVSLDEAWVKQVELLGLDKVKPRKEAWNAKEWKWILENFDGDAIY